MWERVDRNEYRVVFATPEVLLRSKSHFNQVTLRKPNEFRKHLTLIAMDEAHTVWGYRRFRSEFKNIGKIRSFFPDIPFAALSATLPPHVIAYIQRVCKMKTPSDVITVNGRRVNIDIIVREQGGRFNFDPLLDLIPSSNFNVQEIAQTLIFVDSVITARKLVMRLRRKLAQFAPNARPKRTIRAYYSSIDITMKTKTLALVNKGSARIIICTDSMSLGVDFDCIERVIQWGIDEKITFDVLVQRIGRAARGPDTQGVAVVFAAKRLLNTATSDWEKAWENFEETNSIADDGLTHADNYTTDTNALPLQLKMLSLPVLQDTLVKVANWKNNLYQQAATEGDAHAKTQHKLGDHGMKYPRIRRETSEKIDPGLLWFLCTVGCRHRCILSYMDYPDVFDDSTQKSWCCDNCVINKGLPLAEIATAGCSPATSARNIITNPVNIKRQPPRAPLRPPRVEEWAPHVRRNVYAWRTMLWEKLVNRSIISGALPDDLILPTPAVNAIVKNLRRIQCESTLRTVLKQARFDVSTSLMRAKDLTELFGVIEFTLSQMTIKEGKVSHRKLHTDLSPRSASNTLHSSRTTCNQRAGCTDPFYSDPSTF